MKKKRNFFLNALETKDLIKSKTYKFSQQENKKDIGVHNRTNEVYSLSEGLNALPKVLL